MLFLGETEEKVLQTQAQSAKLETTADGWLICPVCRMNRRLMRIEPDAEATGITVFCRRCKNEIRLNVKKGEGFKSEGQ